MHLDKIVMFTSDRAPVILDRKDGVYVRIAKGGISCTCT